MTIVIAENIRRVKILRISLLFALCIYLYRRSTLAWLHNLAVKDNCQMLLLFLAFFELILRKSAKLCNQACVERRTPLNKYGMPIAVRRIVMDDSSSRLNFDLGKKKKIHHYSYKEQLKISKIAKFGREML